MIEGNPGYVNYTDVDRLLHTFTHITEGIVKNELYLNTKIAIGGKHGNACGASIDMISGTKALQNMLEGNLKSIFGGSVLVNFCITLKYAKVLREYKQENGKRLLDVIIAPEITDEARELLGRKGEACKMIVIPGLANITKCKISTEKLLRPVRAGFILQDNYSYVIDFAGLKTGQSNYDLLLAWAVCATSNSNTTTLVKDCVLIGNGVGQQDRAESCELAVKRAHTAGHDTAGAIACTDSFFPFTDAPEVLISAGIRTILGNSGSVNDAEIIDFCKVNKCELMLIPNNDGRVFFGH